MYNYFVEANLVLQMLSCYNNICMLHVQGLSELAVQQERDRSESLLKDLSEREAKKTKQKMEEQHTRCVQYKS